MSKAIELRAERAAIVSQMSAALASNRADKMARWKELDKQQEALRVQIENLETRGSYGLPSVGSEYFNSDNPRAQVLASVDYRNAANNYMRTGERSAELRALATGGDGSVLIPTGFQREIEVYRKAIGGPRLVSRVVTTSTGNNLPWPIEDDTANAGTWLAESAGTSETDPTFTNALLYADLISSGLVKVPVELMQDSAFSMEATLSESFGIRLARGQAQAFTTGNGLQISGLITDLVSAGGRSVLAVGANSNSGNSGDTDLNSIGTDDFNALISKVDKAYRVGGWVGFMGNQSAFDHVRQLKDKYGRLVWSVSLASNDPDQILGYPWIHNQEMASIGAGNISMCFGNFSKYIIRDVLGMTMIRYNELFMQNRQIGYEAYARTFGKLLNGNAFSYLIHPLS